MWHSLVVVFARDDNQLLIGRFVNLGGVRR